MANTDTELDTIAALVAEKLKEQQTLADKKDGTQQAVVTTQNSPLELNLLGQKFTFKDQAEMEAALAQTFSKTAAENEVLRKQLAEAGPKPGYVTGKEKEEEFNQDHYIELMGKGSKGILDATEYALNHTVFGGKEKNAGQVIRDTVAKAATQDATIAVYQFRERHPEFQLTPETTKIIDGLRNELNQPFSLNGLEAAYGVAQARGLMPSPALLTYQKQLQDAGLQTQLPNNPQQLSLGFQPPPAVSRQTQDRGFDLAQAADNMTLEQLERALRSAGQL